VLDALKFVASTANGRFKAIIEQKVREEAEEKKQKDEAKLTAERAMTDALDRLKF